MSTDNAAPCTFHVGSQTDPKHCRWCGTELFGEKLYITIGAAPSTNAAGQTPEATDKPYGNCAGLGPVPAAPDEKMPEDLLQLLDELYWYHKKIVGKAASGKSWSMLFTEEHAQLVKAIFAFKDARDEEVKRLREDRASAHIVTALKGEIRAQRERADRLQRERDLLAALLLKIAKANVIFPSMCANNGEAYEIVRELAFLKEYHAEAIALSDKLMKDSHVQPDRS